jgi:hypothetical protein
MQTSFYWWIYAPFFIVLGFLLLNSEIYKKLIEFGNKLRGTKTEITKTTLSYGKIIGAFSLIIGFLFLFLAFAGVKI